MTKIMIKDKCLYEAELIEHCISSRNRLVIICDETVANLYGNDLLERFPSGHKHLLMMPAGEQYKTRETKASLEDALLNRNLGRDTLLIALGGGVVLDLAGFIGATYHRGIPIVYCPTTLLAMVDACIGGKTGVNTSFGKNLIGAFKEPDAIFIDPSVISTQSDRDLMDGVIESLKHALLQDPDLFATLEEVAYQACRATVSNAEFITRSMQIKQRIVASDFMEYGPREVLNLGHTIGHALEVASNFVLSHGEAVGLGLITEAYISTSIGLLSQEALQRISQCVLKFIPKLKYQIDVDEVMHFLRYDKKNRNQEIHCVLLNAIGEVYKANDAYSVPIASERIASALQWLQENLTVPSTV